MIYNERQYRVTLKQLESLTAAMNALPVNDDSDWLKVAQRDALKSQIIDLETQLSEYSLIKEGKIGYSENSDLKSLPKVLTLARIGKGLSQKALADILNMSPQQIQRYESSNYMGASLARLVEIASVLGVSVRESWEGKNAGDGNTIFIWEDDSNIRWNEFPFKEMLRRGWLTLKHNLSPAEAVRDYFTVAAGPQFVSALHRKKFHGGNRPNEYALLAWQARVIEKARKRILGHEIGDFEYDDRWVKDLVCLSARDNGPVEVKKILAAKGIVLIIEEHLPGTYLDGAAMMLETGHPVIALTLRHDRLDNFWFVLMHELGHVFLHLLDSLNMDFFDEEESAEYDELEKEADQFALEKLINTEAWDLCLSRFSMTREAVLMDASNLGIHPSIVAGRIRKERNNYRILTELVGQGTVRLLLGEAR